MKVERILKSITPEVKKREIEKIEKVKLPEELQKWVDEYEKVGGRRNDFIWKWVYNISKIVTLSMVGGKYKRSVIRTKFLMIMFVVLIDDVADRTGNYKILKKLLKIPFDSSSIKFNRLDNNDREYIKFTIKVWCCVENKCVKYPKYNKFKKIIKFDVKQILSAVEYSYLVNENKYLINGMEYGIYLSHNMQFVFDVMIDLCCLSRFNMNELGTIRRISLYAQQMTRIGNWLTTWEREIGENDFTSGVFSYALDNKMTYVNDLNSANESKLIKIIEQPKIEKHFLMKWENNYQGIKKIGKGMKSINIDDFLISLEKIMFFHFIGRGYK